MIPLHLLRHGDTDVVVADILARARVLEGRRTERTLTESDARVFLATVGRYPTAKVRVYAQRGAFVATKYKYSAPITILEYTPDDVVGPAQIVVSEGDAKRPHGKGPWVTVNGRKEV